MQRGEVRAHANVIRRPGAPDHRLIVSADPINDDPSRVTLVTLLVFPIDRRLLSVPVGGVGWADATAPEATLRRRLGDVVHVLTADEQAAVDIAIRAAFDV